MKSVEKLVSPNVFNNIFPCNELSFLRWKNFSVVISLSFSCIHTQKKTIKNRTLMKQINCILSDLIASICERCGFSINEKERKKTIQILEKSLINYLWYLIISNCNWYDVLVLTLRWWSRFFFSFSISLSTKNESLLR